MTRSGERGTVVVSRSCTGWGRTGQGRVGGPCLSVRGARVVWEEVQDWRPGIRYTWPCVPGLRAPLRPRGTSVGCLRPRVTLRKRGSSYLLGKMVGGQRFLHEKHIAGQPEPQPQRSHHHRGRPRPGGHMRHATVTGRTVYRARPRAAERWHAARDRSSWWRHARVTRAPRGGPRPWPHLEFGVFQ